MNLRIFKVQSKLGLRYGSGSCVQNRRGSDSLRLGIAVLWNRQDLELELSGYEIVLIWNHRGSDSPVWNRPWFKFVVIWNLRDKNSSWNHRVQNRPDLESSCVRNVPASSWFRNVSIWSRRGSESSPDWESA